MSKPYSDCLPLRRLLYPLTYFYKLEYKYENQTIMFNCLFGIKSKRKEFPATLFFFLTLIRRPAATPTTPWE